MSSAQLQTLETVKSQILHTTALPQLEDHGALITSQQFVIFSGPLSSVTNLHLNVLKICMHIYEQATPVPKAKQFLLHKCRELFLFEYKAGKKPLDIFTQILVQTRVIAQN